MRGERLRVVAIHVANHGATLRSPGDPALARGDELVEMIEDLADGSLKRHSRALGRPGVLRLAGVAVSTRETWK
jgi:hypothetical protein